MVELDVDRLFLGLYQRMLALNSTIGAPIGVKHAARGGARPATRPAARPAARPPAEPGEWVEQRKRRRNNTQPAEEVLPVRRLISQRELELVIKIQRNYWRALTGRDFKITITRKSNAYMSPPKHTFARNAHMQLACEKPPNVLEIGVGVGGELFPSLYSLAAAKIEALEPAIEEFEGRDVWGVLLANVDEFYKTYPELDRTRLQLYQKTAKDFFVTGPRNRRWDIVTLDPPFTVPEHDPNRPQASVHESDLRQCMEWAYHEVLLPMVEAGNTARIFVIKSRYPSQRVSQEWARIAAEHSLRHNNDILANMTFYEAMPACPYRVPVDTDSVSRGQATRGVFFWVFFAFLEERINVIQNDAMWNAIVLDHDQDVYVRAEDFVQPVLEFPYGKNVGSTRFQYTPLNGHPGVKIDRIPNWMVDHKHLPKGQDRPHPEQKDLFDALHHFGKYERVPGPSAYPHGRPKPEDNPIDYHNSFGPLVVDGVDA